MADVYFRPQRLAGDAVFADFVPNLAGVVLASGAVTARAANTTGQIETFADVEASGAVTGQPATTTGVTSTITPVLGTGAVTGQSASATGQVLVSAPVPVDVTGTVQGQAATAAGIVLVVEPVFVTVTGDAQADPATTTGLVVPFTTVTITGASAASAATTRGVAGELKDRSPSLQMKLPDGTWIPINDHMNWIYPGFVDGSTYLLNDTLREAGWTMIANKTTTDYPSPRPIGNPLNLYDGTLTPLTQSAKIVTYGNRYSFTDNGYLTAYRVDVTAGNYYEVFLVRDPLGADIQERLAAFTATTTGWRTFSIEPTIVLANSVFDVVALTNEPPETPTPVTLSYDYTSPQNPAAPAAGAITHSRSQSDLMQISYTDQNGDQTATISNLSAGDTIDGAGMLWTVMVNVADTGYANLTVSPAANGAPTGVQDILFNTTVPTLIEYGVEVDYWLTSPYNVKGLFSFDEPYENNAPNDNAYGTDITVQEIEISPDWEVVAAGEAQGGTASQFSSREVSWVSESATDIDYNEVTTTGGGWVEDGRITLPVDTGHRIRVTITARRTDAVGYYYSNAAGLGYNVGGAVTVTGADIFEETTDPALETRMSVDGQDVVFEVKGQGLQTWHWRTVLFSKEIE